MRKYNELSEDERFLVELVIENNIIAYPLIKTFIEEAFGIFNTEEIDNLLTKLEKHRYIVLMRKPDNKILTVISTKWYNKHLKSSIPIKTDDIKIKENKHA